MTPQLDFTARRRRNLGRELAQKGWYHSIELPDGAVTDGLIPLERLRQRAAEMPIPQDLHGKRVLDVGAWDGWFSFEMERRGAEVVAVDCVEVENFVFAHHARRSKVDYRILDVMELSPRELGFFDIVLFLGVLYHLKHPLLALEKVCELTRDLAIVESFVADDPDAIPGYPRMEFYEHDELGEQLDNWCGPSIDCLLAMCRTAGFARVNLAGVWGERATVACYRKWDGAPPPDATPAPLLKSVVHNRNGGVNFYTARDEYVSVWFTAQDTDLSRDSAFPEVCGFGVHAIDVRRVEDGAWLVSFKLPPGLSPGWHEVRLRVANSAWSAPAPIAVDVPAGSLNLRVVSVCDSATWTVGDINGAFASL